MRVRDRARVRISVRVRVRVRIRVRAQVRVRVIVRACSGVPMAVREWKQPPDAKAEIIDLQLLMCASSLATGRGWGWG